ncbi:MAG: hypothetical protein JW908_09150 [Anaerolineales bacterium]|nr:hypothetical protein [Anaerolineales bacterium]
MASTISWLDFSEQERRKMIEVIASFGDRDTRDEMGLAQIRDGFADIFFPGTTTLMTRARYFLFVPWIYKYYEDYREKSASIARKVRKRELNLIKALKNVGEEGVIGERSGESLNRFPSNIYWNGLSRWEILKFKATQSQYHRSLNGYYEYLRVLPKAESSDTEITQDIHFNWDPDIPDPPKAFPYEATFELTHLEAEYLIDRLRSACTKSLMSHLVDYCSPVNTQDVSYPWLHPQKSDFPDHLQNWLFHAQNFSETMQGSALLYNLRLAELRKSDELIERYRYRIADWYRDLQDRATELIRWKMTDFWALLAEEIGLIHPKTRKFINQWQAVLFEGGEIINPTDNQIMRQIVFGRETWLKRGASRLTSSRHLDMWSGASGTGQLNYRWVGGNRLVRDIQFGLMTDQWSNDAVSE